MKSLAILGMLATAGISSAAILWDQSQLVNQPGAGTGTIAGQHLSMLETGETLFGNGCQGPPTNNVLADDFTIGAGGATVTGFSVFSYITGATAPGVTAANWAIASTPTIGSGLATTAVASSFWSVGGLGVYRVNAGDPGSTAGIRRVQITTVTGLNINLAAGTYFLSWSVTPGNFSPPLPTTLSTHGLNGMQSINNAAFLPLPNGTTPGSDIAFVIEGNAVPEPATMAVLGLGAAALLRRRRKQ